MRPGYVSSLQRRLLGIVLRVVRYPKLTLLICALALAGCVTLAFFRLSIDTDQDKLFSPNVPFFKAFLEYEDKFPENEALYIVVDRIDRSKDAPIARWTSLADGITARLSKLDKIVEHVECRTPIDALGREALLFQHAASVHLEYWQAQQELVPLAKMWAEQPNLLAAALAPSPMQRFMSAMILAPQDAQEAKFLTILANSWSDSLRLNKPIVPDLMQLRATDPGDLGYEYVADQADPANHLLLISVYLVDDSTSASSEADQVDAVRAAADAEAQNFPEFKVGITGRPALDADEMSSSDRDSTHAEILALIAIFIGVALALHSIWLAAAAEICLAVAIGWTFGWTTVSEGELNILSLVFLITLIAIGMDYLVQILIRYRREARRYQRPSAIWTRVFRHVSPPICTACMGAAGAFLVMDFTDFRGAAQLGVVAGGGLLLCLISGYTVLPALLVLFPPKLERVEPARRYAPPLVPPSPFRRLLPPAIWIALLLIVVPFAGRTYFNPNLLDMQAKNLESVKLVRQLQTWSAVVMSPDLVMLRKIRDAAAASPTVASTDGIISVEDNYQWLIDHPMPAIDWYAPLDLTAADLAAIKQTADLLSARWLVSNPETAAALHDFAGRLSGLSSSTVLSQWQMQFAAEMKNLVLKFSPLPLRVKSLPDALRTHLVSADGTYALYVWPKENLWQRQPLERFVLDVEGRMEAIPGHPLLTGIAPEMYHSTRSIEIAFYASTAMALGLVVCLVMIDLRSIPQTLITISVLGLGLPMLIGLMGLLGIDWNFANFFGLPILIGAGHEYGVFMTHRYREAMHDRRRIWGRWDASDRALLLCAYVTTTSFAFFWWLGHHEGLRSLGLVMAMGTACIYLAALLVVRPLLKWRIERVQKLPARQALATVQEAQ
jgi:uncharacterized protein